MTVIIGYTNFELAERPNHSMVLFLFEAWVKICQNQYLEANQLNIIVCYIGINPSCLDYIGSLFCLHNYFMMTKPAFCSLLNGCFPVIAHLVSSTMKNADLGHSPTIQYGLIYHHWSRVTPFLLLRSVCQSSFLLFFKTPVLFPVCVGQIRIFST